MPHLDGDCFEAFLKQLRQAYPDEEIVLVLDQAGAHISGEVKWPEGISPLFLPPRSPELDPAHPTSVGWSGGSEKSEVRSRTWRTRRSTHWQPR